jgi:hypothetical protein
MGTLFDKAKKEATSKSIQKDEKIRISVGHDFYDKVEMLEILQDNMKRDKAKADMLSDEIKEVSKEEWIKLYTKSGKTQEVYY